MDLLNNIGVIPARLHSTRFPKKILTDINGKPMVIRTAVQVSKVKNLDRVIDIIIECNNVLYDKIYVFQNEDDNNQLLCTYNVEYDENYVEGTQDTISLHRKKQTNTLYTINALNETIRSLNNGKLDKSYPVPWENYQNKLLLTNESGLNIVPTKIFKIIDVTNWEKNIGNV